MKEVAQEFDVMAHGLACPNCMSKAKKEVYRCVRPRVYLVKCLNCEEFWQAEQVFQVAKEVPRG